MRAKPYQINNIRLPVKPNQQEITFYMAFHMIGIITSKHMRAELSRNRFLILQFLQDCEQLGNLSRIATNALIVFFILRCRV